MGVICSYCAAVGLLVGVARDEGPVLCMANDLLVLEVPTQSSI